MERSLATGGIVGGAWTLTVAMAASGCEAGLISTVNTAEGGAAAAAAEGDGARLSLCSEGKPGHRENNELFCFFVKLKSLSRAQCQEWGLEQGRRAALENHVYVWGWKKKEKRRKEKKHPHRRRFVRIMSFSPSRDFHWVNTQKKEVQVLKGCGSRIIECP